MIELEIDSIINKTAKAILVKKNSKVTWLPLQYIRIKNLTIEIPEWLYSKLIWTYDSEDINLELPEEESKEIKSSLQQLVYSYESLERR